MLRLICLAILASLAACETAASAPRLDTPAHTAIGAFAGEVDVQTGVVTIVAADDRVAQALMAVPVSTGNLGVDSVTISSANRTVNCAGYTDGSICVDVTIASHYTGGALRNVFFQVESMSPDGTNVARNSDAPLPGTGLSATYGLWGFGVIAAGGTATRQWVFDTRSGTTVFRFFGRAYADPPCAADGTRYNCGPAASCQNLATDPNNCGYCGNVCFTLPGSSPACVGSACTIVCNANRLNCNGLLFDGCEVHKQTDAANCGTCGHACAMGQTCGGGTCH